MSTNETWLYRTINEIEYNLSSLIDYIKILEEKIKKLEAINDSLIDYIKKLEEKIKKPEAINDNK